MDEEYILVVIGVLGLAGAVLGLIMVVLLPY